MLNKVAAYSIAFSGLVHIYLAPQHYSHAPAHGIFFVVAGIAELIWAYLFLRMSKPSENMFYFGIMLSAGLIVFWGITRVLPAPFEHEIGEIDLGGIISKLAEVVGLLALLRLAAKGKVAGIKRSFGRLFSEALIVGLFVAFGLYIAGHEFEPLMPFLAGEHEEQEELAP